MPWWRPMRSACAERGGAAAIALVLAAAPAVPQEPAPSPSPLRVVSAAAGDAVRLVLEEQKRDLVLTVTGPDGSVVAELHDPDIVDRPERWTFLATAAGDYGLAVRAAGEGER